MRSRAARSLLRVALPAVLVLSCATPPPTTRAPSTPTTPSPAATRTAPAPWAQPSATVLPGPVPVPPVPAAVRVDPRGRPSRVTIDAIDVDADLVRVGLEEDGSMETPDFGLAGWYDQGPKPGHPGPAVIVAHVDTRAGPDVFARLGELTAGDEIHVDYDSGDTVTFVAASQRQTPKDDLPVEEIWPVTAERHLTLITCGGDFDRGVGHYRDNVIVFTTPQSATAEPARG